LQEVAQEMRKVNWPSRDELISSTMITLVATLMVASFIFLADQVISSVLEFIYQ
jgi:preprotein translocase subunit SecE